MACRQLSQSLPEVSPPYTFPWFKGVGSPIIPVHWPCSFGLMGVQQHLEDDRFPTPVFVWCNKVVKPTVSFSTDGSEIGLAFPTRNPLLHSTLPLANSSPPLLWALPTACNSKDTFNYSFSCGAHGNQIDYFATVSRIHEGCDPLYPSKIPRLLCIFLWSLYRIIGIRYVWLSPLLPSSNCRFIQEMLGPEGWRCGVGFVFRKHFAFEVKKSAESLNSHSFVV